MNTDMLVFVAYFQKHVLLRFDDNLDKNIINFQIVTVQPQGVI